MISLLPSKKNSISFSTLPSVLQRRFSELADSRTFSTFSKLSSLTHGLTRRRKTIPFLFASNRTILQAYNSARAETLKHCYILLKTSELFYHDVAGIYPTYSWLCLKVRSMDVSTLLSLFGPRLYRLRLSLRLIYSTREELNQLADALKKIKILDIDLKNTNATEVKEIEEALAYVYTPKGTKKYKYFKRFFKKLYRKEP